MKEIGYQVELAIANKETFLNKRIYFKSTLENIIKQFNNMNRPVLGPLNIDTFKLVLNECAFKIDDMFMEDDTLYATISFLKTPMGIILQEIADVNFSLLNFYLIGLGTINNNDNIIENYDFLGLGVEYTP